jgi:hypothetical protein
MGNKGQGKPESSSPPPHLSTLGTQEKENDYLGGFLPWDFNYRFRSRGKIYIYIKVKKIKTVYICISY